MAGPSFHVVACVAYLRYATDRWHWYFMYPTGRPRSGLFQPLPTLLQTRQILGYAEGITRRSALYGGYDLCYHFEINIRGR